MWKTNENQWFLAQKIVYQWWIFRIYLSLPQGIVSVQSLFLPFASPTPYPHMG